MAWAALTQRYLVAWQNKDDTDADEIQIREYDATLAPHAPMDPTNHTTTGVPLLASDGSGFTLAARGWSPNAVVVDYIAADNTVTPQADPSDVAALPWAATAHGGQPIVAWLTAGQLWVDAACAP